MNSPAVSVPLYRSLAHSLPLLLGHTHAVRFQVCAVSDPLSLILCLYLTAVDSPHTRIRAELAPFFCDMNARVMPSVPADSPITDTALADHIGSGTDPTMTVIFS